MCGFAGFVSYGEKALDAEARCSVLRAMGQRLSHRGPDDQQIYDDGVLSLVFRRLSIVGGESGRQPIGNECGNRLLVCNGEIYNHQELRAALAAKHVFKSQSDCEALLHAHEEWGGEAFERVRGMFALAIWDKKGQQLVLARDRLGIKPLYVCQLPNGLLFGSELKALLVHPLCPREVDWAARELSTLSPISTPTFIHGVEHIPAGSYLQISPGPVLKRSHYWSLAEHFGTAKYGLNATPYIDEYRQLVEAATVEHLQGDCGFGIHLSGGVDSSLLTAIVARHGMSIPCFTVVERTTHLARDTLAARETATSLGMPWYPVLFDYRTFLDDIAFDLGCFEESVWMMDSPRFDLEWFLKQKLTRTARILSPDIKVLLLGQGADEFAGGYSTRLDRPHGDWPGYLADEVLPMLSQHGLANPAEAAESGAMDMGRARVGIYHQAMSLMSSQLQHHNLWHEDRTSSWNSIEARVPFLDHRIVELLASAPAQLHAELFWNKRIVRETLRHFLPSYDIRRPKLGFCSSSDTRSIQIIAHSMACRLARDFQEKYMALPDFPFERAAVSHLVAGVLERRPGFYADSFRLLSKMAAAIFGYQCQSSGLMVTSARRDARRSLEVVSDARWAELDQLFASEPATPYRWHLEDVPRLPTGASVRFSYTAEGSICELIHNHAVSAEIGMPVGDTWVLAFLNHLNDFPELEYSVANWLDEFQIELQAFVQTANILLQCGFVVVCEKKTAPIPIQPHVQGVRRRRDAWSLGRLFRAFKN